MDEMKVVPHIEEHARYLCDHARTTICGKAPIWETTDAETRNHYRRHALWCDEIYWKHRSAA